MLLAGCRQAGCIEGRRARKRQMVEAVGFHGTSRSSAQRILEGGFRPSVNPYDWLGDGFYFFQDGLTRARQWAEEQHGSQAVVLQAHIDLGDCLDLLDRDSFALVSDAYDIVVTRHRQAGLPLPAQRGGAHGMDRLVINETVKALELSGQRVGSVRAVFQEGRPAFPGSALYDQAHIQIAVRHAAVITRLELVVEDAS